MKCGVFFFHVNINEAIKGRERRKEDTHKIRCSYTAMTLLRDSITLRHEPHVISMIRAWNVKTQQHSKNWENMYVCVEENWNIETILVTSYLQYSCKHLNFVDRCNWRKMNNFDFLLHINYHRTQFFTFNRKLNMLRKCFFLPMPYFRKGHRDIEWLVTISQNL